MRAEATEIYLCKSGIYFKKMETIFSCIQNKTKDKETPPPPKKKGLGGMVVIKL